MKYMNYSYPTNRYPPFFDEHPFRIYEKILDSRIDWPRHIDPQAKDLIKKLLVRDVTRRLGTLKVRLILVYRWFRWLVGIKDQMVWCSFSVVWKM